MLYFISYIIELSCYYVYVCTMIYIYNNMIEPSEVRWSPNGELYAIVFDCNVNIYSGKVIFSPRLRTVFSLFLTSINDTECCYSCKRLLVWIEWKCWQTAQRIQTLKEPKRILSIAFLNVMQTNVPSRVWILCSILKWAEENRLLIGLRGISTGRALDNWRWRQRSKCLGGFNRKMFAHVERLC
jgi:hypothetical protein